MSGPVIVYVHDLRASGVVVAAINFARWLGKRRETILCAGYNTGLFHDVDMYPARLVTLREQAGRNRRLTAALELRRIVRAMMPAGIFSMGNLGHRSVLWGTSALPVPTIYLISKDFRRRMKLHKRILGHFRRRWLIASAHRLVIVGRGLLDAPLLKQAHERGQAVYIPNGVDLTSARKMAQAPCPHPWLEDKSSPVVISVGRIHRQKNHEGLVEAAALAMNRVPFRLVIVGDGPDEVVGKLRRRIEELGITDRVHLAGITENVFAWLARSDLFALPSHWEGSSIALLEAMAVGVPVLASAQAGDADYVLGGGKHGVLVDANSTSSIADGILHQLSPERVLPGDRAEAFSLDKTHDLYASLLTDIPR